MNLMTVSKQDALQAIFARSSLMELRAVFLLMVATPSIVRIQTVLLDTNVFW